MKVIDCLNIDKERNEENIFLIHFFKDGGWWSAYDLSAVLSINYKNENNNKLNAQRRLLKKENVDYVKISLQKESSFERYFPNYQETKTIIDETHFTIDARNHIDLDINVDNYMPFLNEFKKNYEIKEINVNDTKEKTNVSLIPTAIKNVNHITVSKIFDDVFNLKITDDCECDELKKQIDKIKNNIFTFYRNMFN